MKSALTSLVLAVSSLTPAVPAQADWTRLTPTPRPPWNIPLLDYCAVAYDDARAELVHVSPAGQWHWDGTAWAQVTPGSGPFFNSYNSTMVFDSARNRLVLHGGRDQNSLNESGSTWEWDGAAWTEVATSGPSARYWSAMAFDAGRNVTVLFGGRGAGASGDQGDTWEWNGTTWTDRTPATGPSVRNRALMVYDAARGETVLVGGVTQSGSQVFHGDTWSWDGAAWTQRSPATAIQNGLYNGDYDDARQQVVVWSGATLYVWDGSDWTAVSTANPGPNEIRVGSGFDSANDELVVLTRDGATSDTATWIYSPPAAAGVGWTDTAYTVGTSPRDVIVADLTGDGSPDVATANHGSNDVTLLTNDGSGGFAGAPITVAVGAGNAGPVALHAGDLDGDGNADDVAVACFDSDTICVITDVATTAVASSIASAGLRPVDIAVADLDGTGADDIVVGREGELLGGGGGVEVRLGAGAPTTLTGGAGTRVTRVAACDLDGLGDNDIVAVVRGNPDEIQLFDGDGLGGFTYAGAIALSTSGLASGLCCGDIDGDGDVDLVVLLTVLFPTPATDVQVYSYTGSGALDAGDYTASALIPSAGSFAVDAACGDFEDDSIPGFQSRIDLAVVNAGSNDALAHLGFSGGAFGATSAPATGTNPIATAIADLNADGSDDVVFANQGSDDVTVNLTQAPALITTFGTGCAGTGGLVPQIGANGLPTLGNAAFQITVANARANAPALLMFSAGLLPVPLGGGCEIYVAAPIISLLTFSDGAGDAVRGIRIPSTPTLIGFDAYWQWAIFDPAGAFANLIAFSNGLRMQVGS